jgi:hypothetical protein
MRLWFLVLILTVGLAGAQSSEFNMSLSITGESCYDGICNNDEDCTRGLTSIPDCGGPCPPCPSSGTGGTSSRFTGGSSYIPVSPVTDNRRHFFHDTAK